MRDGETGWLRPGSGILAHGLRRISIRTTMGHEIYAYPGKLDAELIVGLVTYKNDRGQVTAAQVTVPVEVTQEQFEQVQLAFSDFNSFIAIAKRELTRKYPEFSFFQPTSS